MIKKGVIMKKGQVSFFIIIALILLIFAGIFIYYTYVPSAEEAAELTEFLEQVPDEFQPVYSYVQKCLYDTAVIGLEEIGRHGGYISADEITSTYNSMEPTESDGLRVFPDNPMTTIPYWYYFRSDNDCRTGCSCGSMKPQLNKQYGADSVESRMDDFIETYLDACLRDFNVFRAQGMDISAGNPEADLVVRQNDIEVNLKYPISMKREDTKAKIEEFYVTIPINLRRIYELADQLAQTEQKWNYLERWTQELVEVASFGPDEEGLPPTIAFTFDPGKTPVFWSKTESKKFLVDNILTPNIPLFQVWGTGNYQDRKGIYQKTTIPVESPTNTSYYDLFVNFEYLPLWPVFYDITGRGISGEIIGPEKGFVSYFSFLGIHRYTYYHDISYPVKIDIYDPYALDNKGYHFIFAMEANIRDNKPLNCSGEGRDYFAPPTLSLMCDYGQGCANVTIVAVDEITGQPVEDVILLYGAGGETCTVGVTKNDSNLGFANAQVSLPQCLGGGCTFTASKYGYISSPVNIAARCDISSSCSAPRVLCPGEAMIVNISRQKQINITVMKKPMLKGLIPLADTLMEKWQFRNEAKPLLPNERAIVSLQKIKSSEHEEDFNSMVMVDGSNPTAEIFPGLVPGKYKVSISLLYDLPDVSGRKSVVFKSVEECTEGGIFTDEECFTFGPYSFNNTIVEGGAEYNLTLTKDDLKYDKILFFAISVPDSSSFNQLDFHDMELFGKTEELSNKYNAEIQPQAVS